MEELPEGKSNRLIKNLGSSGFAPAAEECTVDKLVIVAVPYSGLVEKILSAFDAGKTEVVNKGGASKANEDIRRHADKSKAATFIGHTKARCATVGMATVRDVRGR
jgi:hypothetical protein